MNDDGDEATPIYGYDHARDHALGEWTTEKESANAFDVAIESCGLFARVYREVRGYLLAPRINRETKEHLRIDRVLMPGPKLIERGWTHDIGVEIKKSGRRNEIGMEREKLGPALAQAIDYTHCAWNVGTHWIWCRYFFLWPFAKQYNVAESVMAQNCIGVVYPGYSDTSIVFQLERQVIRTNRDGSKLHVATPRAGRKVGSR